LASLKERDQWEGVDVLKRMVLLWILKEVGSGVDLVLLAWEGDQWRHFYENCHKTLVYLEGRVAT
jgi:hypothetical protein